MGQYIPLKFYFDKRLAERLSELIKPIYPSFDSKSFIFQVSEETEEKELKARVAVIAKKLREYLPAGYEEALAILLSILGPENKTEEGMFKKGYFLMPIAYFVEVYGQDHFDLSMGALVEITKRHTSEYALRPYLAADPDRCMPYFEKWKADPSPHVRRLVSEGTRPRLPWAKKIAFIKGDVHNNLQLLDSLLSDSSRYVQKSVANHINDLTKEESEAVVDWLDEKNKIMEQISPFMIKHSLRTLVKQKDEKAVQLIEELAQTSDFNRKRVK